MEIIAIISTILQFIAATIIIRMFIITERHFIWILIASAVLLMTIHRTTMLIPILREIMILEGAFFTEYVALIVSALLLLGLFLMMPIFRALQKNKVELSKTNKLLIQTQVKAEENDRLKSAFLANMSHEIRTPMNSILGFANLLREPNLSGVKIDRYVEIIEKSSTKLMNTINDIIDISKIEAGQVEVINTEISINKILEEQYNLFEIEAREKGIKLVFKPSLSEEDAHINTDKHKFKVILGNLIQNAIKFTEYGVVSFGYILRKEKNFKEIEFYVQDTGIGIASNRIQTIFNHFEQAELESTRVYEGNGLGLAISKSYVEMLGGYINVISKKDFGSKFVFTIPCNKQNIRRDEMEKKINKHVSFKNLSLIIAEDNRINQSLLKVIFENKFKKTIYTKTGKETLDKFLENPEMNIILMDLKMPNMNGFEATREIRKFNKDVIIIAQSAYELSDNKRKAIEAGCNDYISKPIDKVRLLALIKKYC